MEALLIPCGLLISMLGAGPLKDTVTSFKLGSKGNCQVLLTPPKWSVDNRWTLDDCTASSTHFRTYQENVRNAGITDRLCCRKQPVGFCVSSWEALPKITILKEVKINLLKSFIILRSNMDKPGMFPCSHAPGVWTKFALLGLRTCWTLRHRMS